MSNARRLGAFLGCVVIAFVCQAAVGYEIGRYITDDYDGDPFPECEMDNLNITGMTHDWKEELLAHSGWTSNNEYNHELTNKKLVDPDKYSGGEDYNYIESIDIVLLGGHGGEFTGATPRYRYKKENEYYDTDSYPCYTDPRNDMDLGETVADDVEVLHLVSCNSLEKDDNKYHNTWDPVMHGIHQINGFHGNTYSSDNLDDDYYRVARDGYGNSPISTEWIVELYEGDFYGSHDNCPTSYARGGSGQSASEVLDNEKYSNLSSFTDITSPTSYRYDYLDNCDPDSGDPM